MDNNTPNLETAGKLPFAEKYRRALWYISFALVVLLYVATIAILIRFYIPYSFFGYVTSGVRTTVHMILGIFAAVIPFASWLSNVLVKKVNYASIISLFAVCAVLVAAPFLLRNYDYRAVSYAISAYLFFAMPVSIALFADSLFGYSYKRVYGTVIAAIGFVATAASAALFLRFALRLTILSAITPAVLLPLISLSALLVSLGRMFGVLRTLAVVRQYVLLGICAVATGFRITGQPINIILASVAFICALFLVYDYIANSFLRKYKENKE